MTHILVILALLVGAFAAFAALGLGLAIVYQDLARRQEVILKTELRAEKGLRTLAEAETAGLRKAMDMQAEAIEKGALPWFAKSDKLEARYESEAIDRLENPSYYADVVDGLGGTR